MTFSNIAKTLAAASAIAAASVAFTSVPAKANDGIQVVMNQAKIVRLTRPADTIVVGNPQIIDAAVQDPTTIVLTGKGYGVTNLVILDSDGEPIVDEAMYVSRDTQKSLRVYRRSDVDTLSCTPYCEQAFSGSSSSANGLNVNQMP